MSLERGSVLFILGILGKVDYSTSSLNDRYTVYRHGFMSTRVLGEPHICDVAFDSLKSWKLPGSKHLLKAVPNKCTLARIDSFAARREKWPDMG